jgi:hypothetical protein
MIALALLTSGCLTAAQKIHGPDGREYTRIECNGAIQTMAACFDKANEVCPRGYYLAGQNQQEGSRISTATANVSGNQFGFAGQSTALSAAPTYRSLVVACK